MITCPKSINRNQGYRKQGNFVLFLGLCFAMLIQLAPLGSTPMGLVCGLNAGSLILLAFLYKNRAISPLIYLFLFSMVFAIGGTFLNENGFSYLYLVIGFHLVIYEADPRKRLLLFSVGFFMGCLHLWQPHADFAFAVADQELRFASTLTALITAFLIVWIHLLAVRTERMDYKYMSETLSSYLDELRASNLILLKFDVSGEVLFSNEAATRLFPTSKLHAMSLPSQLADPLASSLSSGLSLERRVKIADRYFRFRFLPENSGGACHVVGERITSNHFITREEEHLVLNALDASSDPILVFDAHLTTRYANRAARLFVKSSQSAEQQSPDWSSMWQENDQALLMHQVLPTLKSGQSWLGTMRLQGCDAEKDLLLHLHRIDGGSLLVQLSTSFKLHTTLNHIHTTMNTSSNIPMNEKTSHTGFSPKDLVNNLMHAIHLRTDMSRLCFSARIHHTVPQQLFGDGDRISKVLTHVCQTMLEAKVGQGLGLHLKAFEEPENVLLSCTLSVLEPASADQQALAALEDSLDALNSELGTADLHLENNTRSDASVSLSFSFLKDTNTAIAATSAEKGSLRILLVDDDPINLHLGTLMLQRMGHKADRAEHGRQALNRMEAQSYDLVIMDLHMPIMDGFEAAKAIKSLHPSVHLVASSAHFAPEDLQNLSNAGFDGHIQKPFSSLELKQHLERCKLKDTFQSSKRA